MIRENAHVFQAQMDILGAAFGREVDLETKRVYWRALQRDVTIEQFQQACDHLVKTHRFFPTIADVQSAAKGSIEYQALKAWQAAYGAMCNPGAAGAVVFDDPCVSEALRACGRWPVLCRTDSQATLDRQIKPAFYRAYVAARARASELRPTVLYGDDPRATPKLIKCGTDVCEAPSPALLAPPSAPSPSPSEPESAHGAGLRRPLAGHQPDLNSMTHREQYAYWRAQLFDGVAGDQAPGWVNDVGAWNETASRAAGKAVSDENGKDDQ